MKIRKPAPAGTVLATIALVLALALVPAAFAGKGGGGGGGGGGHHSSTSYTGSFVGTNPMMVTDTGTSGLSYGDSITFDVTSNATYYFVELDCSQGGAVVYRQSEGFYPGWPWSQTYTLKSTMWTGGAASCSARLYSSLSDGSNQQTLATMSVDVGA